jgi:hypothetical protein
MKMRWFVVVIIEINYNSIKPTNLWHKNLSMTNGLFPFKYSLGFNAENLCI